MIVNKPNLPTSPPERPSEDDLAQAALGGPRGAPELGKAPMTPQREKKTQDRDEPEHPA